MTLGLKDLYTTILALLTVGLYYAMTQGISIPLVSGYRVATLLLLVIGIGMCAIAGGAQGVSNIFVTIASILGAISLILVIWGLVTGSKTAFVLLAFSIVALWVISTTRHFISK